MFWTLKMRKRIPIFDLDSNLKEDKDTRHTSLSEDWATHLDSDDRVSLGLFFYFQLTKVLSESSLDQEKHDMIRALVDNCDAEISEQRDSFYELLVQYTGILASSDSDIGRTCHLHHDINTGVRPVWQTVRKLPPPGRQVVQELLSDMLDKDIIQPSSSPWALPIVLVKKDGSFRFCVDYRKLNEVTYKDAYPLHHIDDTLNTLAGSKWFSTFI